MKECICNDEYEKMGLRRLESIYVHMSKCPLYDSNKNLKIIKEIAILYDKETKHLTRN